MASAMSNLSVKLTVPLEFLPDSASHLGWFRHHFGTHYCMKLYAGSTARTDYLPITLHTSCSGSVLMCVWLSTTLVGLLKLLPVQTRAWTDTALNRRGSVNTLWSNNGQPGTESVLSGSRQHDPAATAHMRAQVTFAKNSDGRLPNTGGLNHQLYGVLIEYILLESFLHTSNIL